MAWWFWLPVVIAGVVGGACSGTVGVFLVGMRIPFLGVCVAHAALAGAVFGSLMGVSRAHLFLPALLAATVMAGILGWWNPHRGRLDDNVMMGFLFSVTMGVAFLGVGLLGLVGRADHDVRALLWGSLLFCRWRDVIVMSIVAAVWFAFVMVFYRPLQALLFSRELAEASGLPATGLWSAMLVLIAVLLTVNLQTVGGLMLYALVTNPAAAAFQLVRGMRAVLVTAAILGALSGLVGFGLAAITDLPTGAMIVLTSSAILLGALLWSRFVGG